MVYAVNTLLLFLFHSLSKKIKQGEKIALFLTFLTMTLIVVLRDGVGADYYSYNALYDLINRCSIREAVSVVEIGYVLLCKFCYSISPGNYWLIHFFMGTITMIFYYLSIRKMSSDYFLSSYLFIAIGLLYSVMNQERQGLAIAVTLYAASFLMEKRTKIFLGLVLIAMLFHTGAAVVILVLFIQIVEKMSKRSRLILIVSFLIATVFALLNMQRIMILLNIRKYLAYFNFDYNDQFRTNVLLNTAFRVIVGLFILITYKAISAKKEQYKPLYAMTVFMIIFQIAAVMTPAFGRISTYFYSTLLILPTAVLKEIKITFGRKSVNNILKYGIVLIMIPYQYVYFFHAVASYKIMPYITIFEK